jgi:hypothetical protein
MTNKTKAGDLDGALKIRDQLAAVESGAAVQPVEAENGIADAKPVAQSDKISLTKMKPKAVTVSWGRLYINENHNGKTDPIAIEGIPCSEWLQAVANSELIYDIPDGMHYFHAIAHSFERKEIFFSVKIDGTEMFKSNILSSYPHEHIEILLEIPQHAKTIQLITTYPPNSNSDGKHSVWVIPEFSKNRPKPILGGK